MEKWSDHQNTKLFIDKAVQALILFKEEHLGLLKLHVHLGDGVSMLEKKKKKILRGGRKTYEEAIQNLLKSCLSYGPPKGGRRVLMRKKLDRQQNEKVLQ